MNIELSNKTILVTGGADFIGSNLCEALLDKKNKVICLDNYAVVAEIWQHTDKVPSDEEDSIRVQDDFGR
jgi:nucleoside-diphosphate-sugar epimerase